MMIYLNTGDSLIVAFEPTDQEIIAGYTGSYQCLALFAETIQIKGDYDVPLGTIPQGP